MAMTQYLGRHVSSLLDEAPFKDWPFERHVEKDLDEPRIYYVFKNGILELFCGLDERVQVIFIRAAEYGGIRLSEIPFGSTRKQVREHLGAVSETGAKVSDPVLGEYGGWDRFRRPGFALHVEYRTDCDAIKQLTVMRSEAIP